MTQLPILVLGATGKTGRRVLDRLTDRGIPTGAGSRSAEPPFDWNDRSTWAPALEGVGGVFFAFSSFVMPALRALPPPQGLAAMQSINVKAVTPVFMTALFGTAAACVAVAVASPDGYRLAGAAAYLVGTIGLTMAFHVPRNNALAALAASGLLAVA